MEAEARSEVDRIKSVQEARLVQEAEPKSKTKWIKSLFPRGKGQGK